ncbi:MAG: dephospho-CoA kinase [Zetaproteobacteria bacterium]|nr:MAG: dephospho-CoA kinase [Zetaproteobacteria bacterium]
MIPAVGLTGGIGSGKSTVARMFADLKVPVLDLDRVGHDLMGRQDVRRMLRAMFGDDIFEAGKLDRGALARRVFNDPAELDRLNALLHPLIWREEQNWLRRQKAPYAIIEASAIIEAGAVNRVDLLIAVLADEELRRQRVLQRGHPSPDLFDAIVACQCGDDERRKLANYIIENHGSLQALERQVLHLHRCLMRRFHVDMDRTTG